MAKLCPGKNGHKALEKIIINEKNIDIQSTDGGSIPWHFHGNNHTHKIILLSLICQPWEILISERRYELTIEGILNQDSLKIKLKKKSENQFILVSRGFHWVNEYPFNR